MKASFITAHGGPEVLKYGELPDPVVGPGEILVRVRSAALNHLDLWVRAGLPGLKLAFPHILGGDAAGEIEALGPGVAGFRKGEAVIVHPGLSCGACESCLSGWESLCPSYRILGEHVGGSHAEFVKVPAANIFRKPAQLGFEEAAAVPLVFTTAWQMLVRRAGIAPGDLVLVHAAGSGVGSAGVQIAKLFGATVIATAGSDEKLAEARKLGADHLVNYSKGDFAAAVKEISPRGCDIIFDHLGKDYWASNLKAVRPGGRVVVCGATTGGEAALDLKRVFARQIQILGSTMGSKGDFARILDLVGQGKLKAVVDKAFPLSRSDEAFKHLAGRQQFGKVLVNPDA